MVACVYRWIWWSKFSRRRKLRGGSGVLPLCVLLDWIDRRRLYASHEQFPVALHQFLRRVESEHFKVQMIHVRHIFSKYLRGCRGSVCLYGATIVPVSAGTPQEMAFAESMVRVIKRMSTAMLAGAPHLPKDSWACADKYAVFLHDLLPQSTRNGHCPYYLEHGKEGELESLTYSCFWGPLVLRTDGRTDAQASSYIEIGHFMGFSGQQF